MKINPVSFNKAQRTCLFWQEMGLHIPDSRCPSEAGGRKGSGPAERAGSPASYPQCHSGNKDT